MKQLSLSTSLFFKAKTTFGGDLIFKKRKSRRPLSTKKPLHLVLRADSIKLVFLHQDEIINNLIRKMAHFFSIKIYESSVNANHLHFIIGFNLRDQYRRFVISLAGRIAQQLCITWASRPFTRIVEWGRDLKNVCAYVMKNQKEAWGLIRYKRRDDPPRANPRF